MTASGKAGGLDLSGSWHGLYSYPRTKAPVHFEASLNETDGWLLGTICETGTVGAAAGLTISASLQGRRTERTVTFLKMYDGSFRGYDSVRYVGVVSEDGTEIEGRWTVPGSWSGAFLMIRARGIAAPVSEEVGAKV